MVITRFSSWMSYILYIFVSILIFNVGLQTSYLTQVIYGATLPLPPAVDLEGCSLGSNV
jgi:hypothetical protein